MGTGNIILYYQLNYNTVTLNLRFDSDNYNFKCDLESADLIYSTTPLPSEIQPSENITFGLGYQYMSVYDKDNKFLYAYPCVIGIDNAYPDIALTIFLGNDIGSMTGPKFQKDYYYGFGLSNTGGDPFSATVTYLLGNPSQASQQETQQSDRRLKTEIKNIDVGLDFITQLNPVSYYKNSDKIEYGIIAQELEEVLNNNNINNSGMILLDNQGMYSVRYNDFIPILMKSIQELKSVVDNQELNIIRQRKINKKLKRMIKNDDKQIVTTEKESIISNKEIIESKILLHEEKDISTCQYIFTKGKNVGNLCGKKTDNKFCKLHTK